MDQNRPAELLAFAREHLGRCEQVADCSWPHRMSAVLRLRDEDGATWFLKQHRDRDRYRSEVTAYRRWVPALGDRAPRLRAFDESLRAVILSPVPGEPAPWPAADPAGVDDERRRAEASVQHGAGRLLRRLHGGERDSGWADFAAAKLAELDQLAPAAARLLTADELALARMEVSGLAAVPGPARVPCHRDYTPRNWLVDAGTVYVLDFEWSRPDAWVSDLARLHLGIWATRPDLREAFLRGYDRELGQADAVTLHGCAVVTAVWMLVKAHESGQASFEEGSRAAVQRLIGGGCR
jgi:Ser/Thr protein kinase RdoA (MazF antagonist)